MSKKDLRVLVIFAGPNGAGKTTFAEKFCQKFKLDFINPDSINAENEVNKGKIFLKILYEKLEKGDPFAFETTMSGKWLFSFLKTARERGYKILCFYIFVYPVEILKYRIEERVKKGGHFVDFEVVKRRYVKSIKNFWLVYKSFFDEWELVNNIDKFEPVAKGEKDLVDVENFFIFNKFLKALQG